MQRKTYKQMLIDAATGNIFQKMRAIQFQEIVLLDMDGIQLALVIGLKFTRQREVFKKIAMRITQ